MTLQLKTTNGLTLEAFLEENGTRITENAHTHDIWQWCSGNLLPVFVVKKGEHTQALVAYSLDEVTRLCLENTPQAIYLVKIVDLLPHVERLEARLKEQMRFDSHRRRMGRFAIPFDEIDNESQFLRAIMDRVIVVRAEAQYASREVAYIGLSEMFDEVPVGMAIPDYLFTATHDQDGDIVDLKADRMK